ncbi:major facilitator superfamily domain-containing protein [Calycina marina]|uniref:Major facilitator superfamily domain-containing protein n=1 Tax=Calycina marina TaxID=1763456 RepID=A0A9P8CBT4_9HELO|nr:major facilitator superfamily domain-containing protein [Calycina marina]
MSSDLEKANLEQIENKNSVGIKSISKDPAAEFTEAQQKKILRRVDLRLVATLGVLYCASLMDRTNLSAASVAGMRAGPGSLNLIGNRYSIIVLIFFIPYVLFQPLAVVVLRKFGPRVFISLITLLWGGCMIGFGFVDNWEQMVGLRALLGVLEAGFFPGCAYLLSCWYTRYELQQRNAIFYLIGSLASACSGILAYGIMQMNGAAGLRGWRWIFIIEGLLTCVAAIGGYFLIVDFPELASKSWAFLSEKEAAFMVERINNDRADVEVTSFSLKNYLANAADTKIWAFGALFGLTTTQSYAIAYFLPVILNRSMGFSIAKSQCLVAPPYAAAAIFMYGAAVLADKWHVRGPIIIFFAIIGLIGLPILGYSTNSAARYFGVFLATISANANIPAILTYQANNIRGQWKRALCSAILVGFGGIGGIIGSTVFREEDAPKYAPGIMTCLIANGLVILITSALSWKFHRANKRAEAGGKIIEGQPGFRYTL